MLRKKISAYITPILIMIGVAMMLLGIWRQEVSIIFMKAVTICFQCIGIG